MTRTEALKLALEALEDWNSPLDPQPDADIITAIKDALAQPEQYDQTALELCDKCGWKTVIPNDCCLNCERKAQPEHERCTPNCEALLQKLVSNRTPLTQNQLDVILGAHDLNKVVGKARWQIIAAMRNIEAAHGIKGQE